MQRVRAIDARTQQPHAASANRDLRAHQLAGQPDVEALAQRVVGRAIDVARKFVARISRIRCRATSRMSGWPSIPDLPAA